jgi:hypothetical protein
MEFYWLLLGILCVWRVTHLLQAEDGPWDVFVRLRRLAGEGFWGRLLDCFYCLSMWIAVPFALLIGQGWKEWLLLWLALSAGAILLERATDKGPATPPALYREDEEVGHGMLWREEATDVRDRSGESES